MPVFWRLREKELYAKSQLKSFLICHFLMWELGQSCQKMGTCKIFNFLGIEIEIDVFIRSKIDWNQCEYSKFYKVIEISENIRVFRQCVRQLIDQIRYTRYHISFYLSRIGPVLKHYKFPKYNDQDCMF